MRYLIKIFVTLILSILTVTSVCFSGCGETYSSTSFTCFNTDVYVYVNGALDEDTENLIKTTLIDLENEVSLSRDSSKIKKFNESTLSTLSDQTLYLIKRAKELSLFTNGKFNPAVYPLLELYLLSPDKFDQHYVHYAPPTSLDIAKVLPLCDFENVILDQENKTLSKTKEGVKIDLGGIAKGYAVDLIQKILIEKGLTSGFINVGGSSIYILDYQKNLSVKHPRKNGEYILSIDCKNFKNAPLSTSGDYVRYYLDNDGNRYSHIIDSKTGKTVNTGFISVTVIADGNIEEDKKSALFTDAISTSLMLMEKDDMIDFVKNSLAGFTVYAVYEKDGLKQIITNADQSLYTIVDASFTSYNI